MAYIQQHSRNILRRIDGVFHHPIYHAGQGIRYRKLQVILTTTIDKLGKSGETVKVAPGYFRNHLMPKMLAVPDIDKYRHLIAEQRKLYQPKEEVQEVKVVPKTEEDKMKEYQTAAHRLASSTVVFRRFVKIEREIREPVTKEEIASEVARQLCVQIEPENLDLPTPLSSMGEFDVPLRLPKSIPMPEGKLQWTLKVKIRSK